MVIDVRAALPDDQADVVSLYAAAFTEEDLTGLVAQLLHDGDVLSLVASEGASLLGHIAFTRCGLETTDVRVALLGPLAVAPSSEGRGVGSALVTAGLARLDEAEIAKVLVLGDPRYYRRFGFARETAIEPPYPLPEAWQTAWQSRLGAGAVETPAGRLVVPAPWRARELWAP
jgi:putative acetyltransferase